MQSDSPRGRSRVTGIEAIHSRRCATQAGGKCSCRPSWRASVYSKRDGRRIRKTFATLAEAKGWRADAQVGVRKGTLRASSRVTFREAAEAWLEAAEAGTIRAKGGRPYKPKTLRSYEASLRRHVLPELGGARISEISRVDVQDFVDRMVAAGHAATTVRNAVSTLQLVFGRALDRGELAINPTERLRLPTAQGRRDRIAPPHEAAALIAAVPERDRALWATAFYGGLRAGELRALRWGDVDLAAGRIRVERGYDDKAGVIETKTGAGRRTVPVPVVLRDFLIEHRHASGRGDDGYVFGRDASSPFTPSAVHRRAKDAWEDAGLDSIGLHEARHTYASLMIAAGVNAKALSTYMGHSSITVTLDRYGHLMPGNEDEAAALLDAYLARADTAARLAQLDNA
jgi:integrase